MEGCKKARYRTTKEMQSDKSGELLFDFICDGKLEKAKLLANNYHCNVNWGDNDCSTPLIMASYIGYHSRKLSSEEYLDFFRVLLRRQDLLINCQTLAGMSALMWASVDGSTEYPKLLLDDPRTDVNLVDDIGHSALWKAYMWSNIHIMKLLISHGANVEGVAESVFEVKKNCDVVASVLSYTEATEVMKNWKLYLPEFTRFAKSNKYYPTEFKEWAFNFILCCLKSRSFPKDIIHLLLEYIARAWKRI